jgi:large subunit ribosomal protein L1
MLPTIAPKLARFLGPKGLMPVAKRGTVREDIAEAISEARGLLDWKGDKQGHVRAGTFRGVAT